MKREVERKKEDEETMMMTTMKPNVRVIQKAQFSNFFLFFVSSSFPRRSCHSAAVLYGQPTNQLTE